MIAGGAAYIWQHGQVTNLDAKVLGLQQQVTSLQAQLNSSPVAAPSSGTNNTGNPTSTVGMEGSNVQVALRYGLQAGKPALKLDNGIIAVTSALYAVYFGNSAYNGEGAILDLTVSNTTSQVQSYNLSNLSLQLPNGTIVTSGEPYVGDISKPDIVTVAPSGSTEEIIGFSPLNPNATSGTGYLRYMSGSNVVGKATLTFKAPLN